MQKLVMLLAGAILFLIPSMAIAIIDDPDPVNINVCIHHETRIHGDSDAGRGFSTFARDGNFMQFDCVVVGAAPDLDYLDSPDDVIIIKAKHLGTKRVYNLVRDDYGWMGQTNYGWLLWIRPADWMFESGNWRVIMIYNGNDGEKHRQKLDIQSPLKSFPPPPTYVTYQHNGAGDYLVTWSGIGLPFDGTNPGAANIDYRIRVWQGDEALEDFRGTWKGGGTAVSGTYDQFRNEVGFTVPDIYAGGDYVLRLENRLNGNRACRYIVIVP